MNTPPLYKKNRSFTIIELLVVFAIFGLIASVILVSMQAARDKARIAKALQFSATIYHSLGADMVGGWRFEESAGSTVADSSNNGNTGTLCRGAAGVCIPYGGADRWEKNSIHELGTAGKFNGTSDYVRIPDSNSLDIRDVITIEAWIKTDSITTVWMPVSKQDVYNLRFNVTPIFYLYGVTNGVLTCPPGSNPFVIGKWHHFVGTYDGSKMKIFVDSKEICRREDSSGTIVERATNLYLGTHSGLGWFFKGLIDEVRIYERALTSAEIQQHYVQGAKNRGMVVKE